MIRPVGEETADMVTYLAKWIKTVRIVSGAALSGLLIPHHD